MNESQFEGCPICGSERSTTRARAQTFYVGRRRIVVEGIPESLCENCGADFQTAEQHDRGVSLVDEAQRRILKITPREIYELRRDLGLTQQQAQRVFGGGPTAFSKYERGLAVPSEASIKLMLVARKNANVFEELCELAGIRLPSSRRMETQGDTPLHIVQPVVVWVSPGDLSNELTMAAAMFEPDPLVNWGLTVAHGLATKSCATVTVRAKATPEIGLTHGSGSERVLATNTPGTEQLTAASLH